MIEALGNLVIFAVQLVLVVTVVGVGIGVLLRRRDSGVAHGQLQLEDFNARQKRRQQRLRQSISGSQQGHSTFKTWLTKKWFSVWRRKAPADARAKIGDTAHQTEGVEPDASEVKVETSAHSETAATDRQSRVWVLDFHGDMKASGAKRLGEEISALLDIAEAGDEVVLRLESPGGLVHAYGHAAAEFDRLRQAGMSTTVCVDQVAASGGYLMACSADKLIAAPFAVLGSIGVVAQVPNIHRLLKRHDIDVELHTAGRYKRTLTLLGENDDESREKFQEDIESVHQLFKRYVSSRRPELDIERVASGEAWYGSDALALELIDELGTSEQYLAEKLKTRRVIGVRLVERTSLASRLGMAVSLGLEKGVQRLIESIDASGWQKR